MSKSLLVKVDVLRHIWNAPIRISPNSGALGRHLGLDDTSQHNIDLYGEVRAMDVFVDTPERFKGYEEWALAEEFIHKAKQTTFTGIGCYPDWNYHGKRRLGFHLDCREDRIPGDPSVWGRIENEYVSLDKAMSHLEEIS